MKTLKEIVTDLKIRKGPAHGTTKRGAFWTLKDGEWFATLRRSGGDGIGQSSCDVTHYLELRHFRSGEVRAVVARDAFHQNGAYAGAGMTTVDASQILDCRTIEEVVVGLKGMSGPDEESVYSENSTLAASLRAIGMPDSEPAPDDVPSIT